MVCPHWKHPTRLWQTAPTKHVHMCVSNSIFATINYVSWLMPFFPLLLMQFSVLSRGTTSRTCYWTWMHYNWMGQQNRRQKNDTNKMKIKKKKTIQNQTLSTSTQQYKWLRALTFGVLFLVRIQFGIAFGCCIYALRYDRGTNRHCFDSGVPQQCATTTTNVRDDDNL